MPRPRSASNGRTAYRQTRQCIYGKNPKEELELLRAAARRIGSNMQVNAGHGINYKTSNSSSRPVSHRSEHWSRHYLEAMWVGRAAVMLTAMQIIGMRSARFVGRLCQTQGPTFHRTEPRGASDIDGQLVRASERARTGQTPTFSSHDVLGIGVDLVECDRIQRSMDPIRRTFSASRFTDGEIGIRWR